MAKVIYHLIQLIFFDYFFLFLGYQLLFRKEKIHLHLYLLNILLKNSSFRGNQSGLKMVTTIPPS